MLEVDDEEDDDALALRSDDSAGDVDDGEVEDISNAVDTSAKEDEEEKEERDGSEAPVIILDVLTADMSSAVRVMIAKGR